jgi:hypothetical protein
MSDFWDRLSKASDIGTETIGGLIKYQTAKSALEAQRQANAFNQQMALGNYNLEQVKIQGEALKTDLLEQGKSIVEMSKALAETPALAKDEAFMALLDRAYGSYNNSKEMYFGNLGIAMPPTTRALDIARHVRSLPDTVGKKWVDGTTEKLVRSKYPDADMEAVKAAWLGLQSMDKDKGDGIVSSTLTNIFGEFEGVPATSDESSAYFEDSPDLDNAAIRNALDILIGAPLTDKGKAEREKEILEESSGAPAVKETTPSADATDSSLLEDALNLLVPSASAAEFRSGSEKGRTTRQRKTIPLEPIEAMGGLMGGMGLMGLGLMGADNYLARQAEADRMKDYGETSQLIPQSAIEELRGMDFGGTGGMLTFGDSVSISPKAKQFLEDLMLYVSEYGEEQGKRYMTRELSKLSEKDQEQVLNAIEGKNERNWGGDFLDTLKYMATGNPYNSDGTRRHYGPELNYPWSHWFKDSE